MQPTLDALDTLAGQHRGGRGPQGRGQRALRGGAVGRGAGGWGLGWWLPSDPWYTRLSQAATCLSVAYQQPPPLPSSPPQPLFHSSLSGWAPSGRAAPSLQLSWRPHLQLSCLPICSGPHPSSRRHGPPLPQAKYSAALEAAPSDGAAAQRAVYFANRAACQLKLGAPAEAAHDCSAALDLNPAYTKVLLRRAAAWEALDDLERALADAQKVRAGGAGGGGGGRRPAARGWGQCCALASCAGGSSGEAQVGRGAAGWARRASPDAHAPGLQRAAPRAQPCAALWKGSGRLAPSAGG